MCLTPNSNITIVIPVPVTLVWSGPRESDRECRVGGGGGVKSSENIRHPASPKMYVFRCSNGENGRRGGGGA